MDIGHTDISEQPLSFYILQNVQRSTAFDNSNFFFKIRFYFIFLLICFLCTCLLSLVIFAVNLSMSYFELC